MNKKQLTSAWIFGVIWGVLYLFFFVVCCGLNVTEKATEMFFSSIFLAFFWFLVHITLRDKPKQ